MNKVYVVVGAGFRGFCDAMQLLAEPDAKVHIVDREPYVGGISYSGSFAGFAVDKGVHMFDGIPRSLADNVCEIMDGRVRTVDFVSVSAFGGHLTDGYSLPDLSSMPEETKHQITRELHDLAASSGTLPPPANLQSLMEQRYGRTAGKVFADIFRRVYDLDPAEAQPDAIARTSLGRLKYLDDEQMLALKASHPFLDSVLAARRKAVGKVDDYVSIYPDTGEAMRGWCERAAKWLQAKGVGLCLGESLKGLEPAGARIRVTTDKRTIEADRVIWTNDGTQPLAALLGFDFDIRTHISGTPMLFATLVTRAENIKDFTYLQNFGPDGITYRTASAGIYSNQIDAQGNSFVTCECPAPIGSERWEQAAQMHEPIWQECKRLGIVSPEAELAAHSVQKLPVTFKVSKVGLDEKIREFEAELARRAPQVVFRDVKPFFRRDIYFDSFKVPDLVAQ